MSAARIEGAFARAKREGRTAFVAYLTADYPDRPRALAAARVLAEHADVIEVGLPFSDPLGDGPTIARASEIAIAGGASARSTLAMVAELRRSSEVPVAVMSYYNPIFAFAGGGERGAESGERRFIAAAREAGVDGLILPDLPPDEGESLTAAARAAEVATIFLVAPTSTDARIERVGEASRGFVYAVSVTGVTGARSEIPSDVPSLVARTRAASGLPVAVGFGVATPEQAARLAPHTDGVVVGSAIVSIVGRMRDEHDTAELAAFAEAMAAALAG